MKNMTKLWHVNIKDTQNLQSDGGETMKKVVKWYKVGTPS